jgi:hypothetical protein
MEREYDLKFEETISAAKQGFRAAMNANEAMAVVNRCPYGPAPPGGGSPYAHAWYRGFWFAWRLRDVFRPKPPKQPTKGTASHSPGPFKIGDEYSNSQDEIEDANGRCVAVVWTRRAPPGATARTQFKRCPEGKGNASLFAASPELLEACKELVAELLSHASLGLNETEVAMLRKAESAISKAEAQ